MFAIISENILNWEIVDWYGAKIITRHEITSSYVYHSLESVLFSKNSGVILKSCTFHHIMIMTIQVSQFEMLKND